MGETEFGASAERLMRVMNGFHHMRFTSLFQNITRNEYAALKAFECLEEKNENPIKVSEVVGRMEVSAPAVSRTLKNLEEKNMILRSVDAKDRRNTLIQLTEEGRACLEECNEIMKRFGTAVWNDMGDEDMDQLLTYLERLQQFMKQEIANFSKDSES